jgi:hypothetical protein
LWTLAGQAVLGTLSIAGSSSLDLRDLGCDPRARLREEKCMDKRTAKGREPQRTVLFVLTEIPADIEVALRSDASGCIQQLLLSEAFANAIGLVLDRRRHLPSMYLSSSSRDCG